MLEVRDLWVRYGPVEALRGVSLQVASGQVVAVLGRNGAGKSSLLRAIAGLVQPWRGEIRLDGQRIDHLAPGEIARRGVALVPEGRRVLGELTVRENLLLGSLPNRAARAERLAEVLRLFPVLSERLSGPGTALSGGQQQMLAIARGLMASPRLLMVDELSLGLAPVVVRDLARQLVRLREEGIAVLLVEQEYPVALRVADSIYVLHKGRVGWTGPPEEAREVLASAYLGGVGGRPGRQAVVGELR